MMSKTDKYAFVTGSSDGLGRALAICLAKAGYHLIIHYKESEEEALTVVKEIEALDRKAFALKGDLTDPHQVNKLFQKVEQLDISLEVFVQNVGNYLKKNILDLSFEEWTEIVNSNLNATFYCNKRAADIMMQKGYGRIVNIGFASLGSLAAKPMITPYYIAKTGVLILTKSLGAELADKGITVNMISPGVLETSISKPVHEIPMGRLARLEEMERALLFLVDSKSEYITGVNLDIAGGWRL